MDIKELERPRQEIEEAIVEGDLRQLLRVSGLVHGHYCPGLAMGVRAGACAVRELGGRSTGMEEVVAIVETNSCFADGIQVVTGCTLGNNALIYRDYGKTAFTLARRNGEAVRIACKPGAFAIEDREPEAMALFAKVVTERKGTEEDSRKLKRMWIDIAFKMMDGQDEELFAVSRMKVDVPEYAHIFASAKCCSCGESIMEPRAQLRNGQVVCLPCSGRMYYQLAGDGISVLGQ